jgi:hypothetical protein
MRFTRFAEALHNANAARRLGLAIQVRKERRMPMRLDDRALQDLGLDKGHAYPRLRLNHHVPWRTPKLPAQLPAILVPALTIGVALQLLEAQEAQLAHVDLYRPDA